jgi:hypothetical protein
MMEAQDAKIPLNLVEFPKVVLRENPVGSRGILYSLLRRFGACDA